MSTPRVTIGVPVWNGARHLEECLDSLLAQTYDDIEVVISDNASTDRTPEICRAYCARDERVTYYRQPRNIGAAANYNFLVYRAKSELFKWGAHDDVCAPEFVELCVAALDSSPTDVLAFPRTTFIDGSGAVLPHPDPAPHADAEGENVPMCWLNDASVCGRLRDLLVGDLLMGDYRATLLLKCTAQFGVIRRSALQRTRLTGNYNSSDVVLLVELALLGGFAAVDECLFLSRIHEGSSLRANTTAADLARWYDPRRGDRYPMPWTRVLHGLVTAVLNSPLSYSEKANALTLVTRWFFAHRRWRMIGGELKIRAREVAAARGLLACAKS
jgi:glycosyltransferase involved in cell wall biosynthesis